LPLEQLAILFWTAVFPELSVVEFVEVEASAEAVSDKPNYQTQMSGSVLASTFASSKKRVSTTSRLR
jgi:hypothetical protein